MVSNVKEKDKHLAANLEYTKILTRLGKKISEAVKENKKDNPNITLFSSETMERILGEKSNGIEKE